MLCKPSWRFSAMAGYRRHHCRCCGWVVCAGCLPDGQTLQLDRWVSSTAGNTLKYGSPTKLKRVCNSCAEHAPAEIAERLSQRLPDEQRILCTPTEAGPDDVQQDVQRAFASLAPPFSTIVRYVLAPACSLRDAGACLQVSRAWRDVFLCAELWTSLCATEAFRDGHQPPWSATQILRVETATTPNRQQAVEALLLSRDALRRRLLVVGEKAALAVRYCNPRSLLQFQHMPMKTTFLLVNATGRPLWCHWIGPCRSGVGEMQVRDGDLVPPAQDTVSTWTDATPRHFLHTSYMTHAFAVCAAEGGRPLIVYQQRRSYVKVNLGSDVGSDQTAMHALRVMSLDPPEVEELAAVAKRTHAHGPRHYSIAKDGVHNQCLWSRVARAAGVGTDEFSAAYSDEGGIILDDWKWPSREA